MPGQDRDAGTGPRPRFDRGSSGRRTPHAGDDRDGADAGGAGAAFGLTPQGWGERVWPRELTWLALALTLAYTAAYLAHPALPGNNPAHPDGWWGWWDQSLYLKSLRAFAGRNLTPSEHWYPPGYALMAAPFGRMLRAHPLFFVDLACLLATARLFVAFAGRVAVGRQVAALIFAGVTLIDWRLLDAWVVPWTSTPTAVCLWAMLVAAADHMNGRYRPVLLGLLPGAVLLLRPSDLIVPAAILGTVALHEAWAWWSAPAGRPLVLRRMMRLVLAGLAGAAVPVAVHVAIHGLRASPYMLQSAGLGFDLHGFGWKAFVLLVEPRGWYEDGTGLLARHPWLALAVIGLPFALMQGPAMRLLALVVAGQLALYVAYVDLLPTGLWRYGNVHYWKWFLPGFGLIALVGLRQLPRAPRLAQVAGVAAALLLLAIRIDPVPAAPGEFARALDLPVPRPDSFQGVYFADTRLIDGLGPMRNINDMRLWPVGRGVRALGLRREFVLPMVDWPGMDNGPARPLAARTRVGWFCWLPPYACKRTG